MIPRPWPGKPVHPVIFALISGLVGVAGGLGAVVFRGLIAFFHNLLFLGTVSVTYDANIHTAAGPWGPGIILVPVVGAVGVAFLVKNFAPEARGSGIPEAMDVIYYKGGIIRPIVAVVKSVASALSIGSGGSLGREGPIIQIGSSFGSAMGQIVPMSVRQRITLVAAGTGAGIAATFNTPVGGILFAIEIMLHEVSVRTLVPVALATVIGTYFGQVFFGNHPAFVIPRFETPYFHLANPLALILYAALGLIIGVASALYIRSIYAAEDFFEKRIKGNYYTQHMIGMFVVGLSIYGLMRGLGHYYVEGVGYATVQDILMGHLSLLSVMLLLFFLKLFATSVTLGSGASGGIFSPALFLGATLGGSYGAILGHFFPQLGLSPPQFAVAGMAGVVGGATGAVMTAIVMIFEMTLDYTVVLPLAVTVAVSNGIRWVICRESIYTLKLARRGHRMPQALRADFMELRPAKSMMDTHIAVVPASFKVDELGLLEPDKAGASYFVVEKDDRVVGVAAREAASCACDAEGKGVTFGEMASTDYVVAAEEHTLFDLLNRMRTARASTVLVVPDAAPVTPGRVTGVITRKEIAQSVGKAVEIFAE
jgi:CIC family chloride channel protein